MTQPPLLFQLSDVSFSYRHTKVLEGIDLQLCSGRFYGLLGANGSGKSTLIELIMGGHKALAGTILYKNKSIESYSRQELATQLALVPQNFAMSFEYQVSDVVLMGRHPHIPRFSSPAKTDREAVADAMQTMDISHLRSRPVCALSGGELQRVVMARALAQETEVLILDEATSNLDIHHTIAIMQVMRKRVTEKGLTVIAAIHDLNLAAAFCDECLVLKEGQLFAHGPVQQLFTSELLHRAFAVEATVHHHGNHGRPQIQFRYQ
ncbi:MAG: ABC transporter ATP-binding protein [Proteobacteria bacterium]|nr:ABC transporter ATP-binding protein [Pseudomonadota bacterium]MBU1058391.1 ABC transporter ATP-binding protein [Pseudomonadota bacterium]